MAFPFPLPLASFFDGLKVASCSFDFDEAVEVSRNAKGELLTADIGARLLVGQVTLSTHYNRDAEAVKARLAMLRQSGRSLFCHPFPYWTPRKDPLGTILGGLVPTIHTLAGNNRELRLQGLPNGYTLSQGDYLSFVYGTNPQRYAIHQIVTATAVVSGGLTPLIEVSTFIRPGAVVGTPVQLIRPFFKAIIIPGSSSPGTSSLELNSGISFSIQQTLG